MPYADIIIKDAKRPCPSLWNSHRHGNFGVMNAGLNTHCHNTLEIHLTMNKNEHILRKTIQFKPFMSLT